MPIVVFSQSTGSDVWVTSETPLQLIGGRLMLGENGQAMHVLNAWHFDGESFSLVRTSGIVRLKAHRKSHVRDLGEFDELRLQDWSVKAGGQVLRFDAATNLWRYVPDSTLWDSVTIADA